MNLTRKVTLPKQALLLGLILFFTSCHSGGDKSSVNSIFGGGFVDVDAFKTAIQKQLPSVNVSDSALKQLLLADSNGMLNAGYAYKLNGYQPIWIDESGLKPFAAPMLDQLKALHEDGLDTARYNITTLEHYIAQLQSKTAPPTDSLAAWDEALTATWLMASEDLLLGMTDIKQADSLWFAANDTAFNGANLLVSTVKNHRDLPSFDTFRSNAKLYSHMKTALKQWKVLQSDQEYIAAKNKLEPGQKDSSLQWIIGKELPDVSIASNDSFNSTQQWLRTYQYYHQLGQSGKLDSSTLASLKQMPEDYIARLKLNLDRLRALPRNVEGEHVWVTIPLMEVGYFKGDEEPFHSRVVVGKLARQTPSLWANMSNVVFNPPWGVPPTILKNDIGPGVGRAGGAYLRRKGLRAFNAQGKDVTYSVNGSNYKKYSYRQPPGAGNSLGEVKFNLPNRWNIYLHDTPHRDNFSHSYRALSSGCVRVQNPKLLAEIILNNDRFTADKIDTIIATRKTKSEKLDRVLPVYIIYATIAEDSTGKQLRYLKDIYKRDEKMLSLY
jgi:murein L,D-transpeptidase YcbB/YkuD